VTGSDGIGDAPYTFDIFNQDNYPLIAPISLFDLGIWNGEPCRVEIVSNSTVSNFQLNTTQKILSFNVTCETGLGFCRVSIPNIVAQNLWQRNYTVLVDGEQPLNIRNARASRSLNSCSSFDTFWHSHLPKFFNPSNSG
jgi:hypothetical protein